MSLLKLIDDNDIRKVEMRGIVELLDATKKVRAPEQRYESVILHLVHVLKDASKIQDVSGRRERFVEWFGDEADIIITTLYTFLSNYWHECVRHGKLLPIDIKSSQQKENVINVLTRVQDTMETTDKGFGLWPTAK